MFSFDSKKLQIFFNVCIFFIFLFFIFCFLYLRHSNNKINNLHIYSVQNFDINQLNNPKEKKVRNLKIRANLIFDNKKGYIVFFKPEKKQSNHKAVIVCPGGGYQYLVYKNEGLNVGKWLAENGYTGVVLFYSRPTIDNPEKPFDELQQTIKIVKDNSKLLNIDSKKVGVLGFSAGGHLVARASNEFKKDSRPDFAALFYPVISMDDKLAHTATRYNLTRNDKSLFDKYSVDKHISKNASPSFIVVSEDDDSVSPKNSDLYYDKLKKNKVSVVIYKYKTGGHGWGWSKRYENHDEICRNLDNWIKGLK